MYLVHGSDGFRCRRYLKDVAQKWSSDGYEIHNVEGNAESISPLLSPMLSMWGVSSKPAFIIDWSDETTDIDYLMAIPHPGVVYVDGSLPRSKKSPLYKIPKRNVKKYNKPSLFKEVETAVDFAIEEASRYDLELSRSLATNFIKIVGADLGIVSYELFKVSMLVNEEKTISPQHFRAIAQVTEVSASDIIEAVREKKVVSLLRSLDAVKRTHSSDPTLLVCGWLGSEVRKWLLCASLKGSGRPLDQTTTGIHPYVLKKNIVPTIKIWSEKQCVKLLHLISRIERYIKTGGKNSWSKLEGELVILIQNKS